MPTCRVTGSFGRRMCLLGESLLPSEREQLSFLSFPVGEGGSSYCYVEEVGFGAAACPRDMHCLQVTSGDAGAQEEVAR